MTGQALPFTPVRGSGPWLIRHPATARLRGLKCYCDQGHDRAGPSAEYGGERARVHSCGLWSDPEFVTTLKGASAFPQFSLFYRFLVAVLLPAVVLVVNDIDGGLVAVQDTIEDAGLVAV